MLNFNVPPEDFKQIYAITKRAVKEIQGFEDLMSLEMDIIATHTNGCPLDLQKLLNADAFNFAHDIVGINNHIDRETGELKNCFLPRCSKPENV